MRDMTFEVDGVDMLDVEDQHIAPIMFSDTVPVEPNRLSCEGNEGIFGDVGPFIITGYFAILPPGAIGRHMITYGGTYSMNGIDIVDRVRTTLSIE